VPRNIRTSMICAMAGAALGLVLAAPKAYAIAESTGTDGSNARAVHALGRTGEGVNVGLISARNVRTTHEAFEDPCGVSHAFNYDFSEDGIEFSGHDTRMKAIRTISVWRRGPISTARESPTITTP
jgi:hypothetical protein